MAINIFQNVNAPLFVQAEPTISITKTSSAKDGSEKLIKVKTTITKKTEQEAPETSLSTPKTKRDIELSSDADVDKILKEMDIDDTDPLAESQPATPVEAAYKPVKKNFIWIAFSVILFPIILFTLLLKAMDATKKRFEKEEKEKGLSKEEKLLDDLEKEQKKTKKRHRSLSEILGGTKQRPVENTAFEDDFDREDEDFEFMVEEVVLVEETASEAPSASIEETKPEPALPKSKKEEQKQQEQQEEINYDQPEKEAASDIIDKFEIDNNLKFLLIKKDEACNLMCNLGEREILIMHLDKAQKFNKVRKIDSKPGRDVYMVKLDSWRGLIEVKADSVKYLMDI